MNPTNANKTSDRYIWAALFAAAVFVYFLGLNIPLLGPDEPRYTQVALEMMQRGDWITTTLGGYNWFEKPALLYWLQITSFHIFGTNEFAARFGSALFGIGTAAALYFLVRFTNDSAADPAKWFAIIALTSLGLIVFARGASFDIVLTFPIAASLSAFFIFDRSGTEETKKRYISLFLFYFFIGVSLLAKGLVGIVFPFAIVSFYYVLVWKFPPRAFIFSLFWGTAAALIVASSWYLPMYLRHGNEFIDEFFIGHHFRRYTSNKYLHPQPFHFFFWVLPLMTIPWIPFFAAAVFRYLQNFVRREPEAKDPLRTFAFAWLFVPLVFFSFSGSKLPGYILPALPAAVILTADLVIRFIDRAGKRERYLQAVAFATLVIVAGLVIFVLPRYAETDSVKSLIAAAAEKGFANEKVAGLHTVSHNAEFYVAGRLIRQPDGKQIKFNGTAEIAEHLRKTGEQNLLILVPSEKLADVLSQENLRVELIKDNTETAILIARLERRDWRGKHPCLPASNGR